jgi:hypothetical protein
MVEQFEAPGDRFRRVTVTDRVGTTPHFGTTPRTRERSMGRFEQGRR